MDDHILHGMLTNLNHIESVKTLKAKYCRFVDTKQWEELASLLAENPTLVFENTEGVIIHKFTTADQFLESCLILEMAVSAHHVHNPEIQVISGEMIQAIWAMEDRIFFPIDLESPFKNLHGLGHYHETYILEKGNWKIKNLLLTRTILNIE